MEPVSRSEEIVDAREQPAALNSIERWTGDINANGCLEYTQADW